MFSQGGHSLVTERLCFLLCHYDEVIDKKHVPSGGVNMTEVFPLSLSLPPTFSLSLISKGSAVLSVQ